MDLKDIFEILPDIILYISSGYIFIYTFSFLSLRKKLEDIHGIFVISLVIGFILKSILCAILKIRFSFYVNIIGFFVFCVLSGCIAGIIVANKYFTKILRKIRINRSVNENIWHDIMDSDNKTMWIRAINTEKAQVIVGILVLVEEFQRYPQMILQQYRVYDFEGELLEDYTKYANHQILIKSEIYDRIDIVYDKDSSHYENVEIIGEK